MNAKFAIVLIALSAALALPTAAFAQHRGGGGGQGHSASGYRAPVVNGGYVRGGGHYSNNYGGHYYGSPYSHYGYGYGSYYRHGYRPYYGYSYGHFYPHYGPLYGGLAFGVYVASLPYYYDTYWWHDVPYYYYGNNYYRYSEPVGKYEVVAPPAEAVGNAEEHANSQLFAYPKENQSEDRQRTDRFECRQWAAKQTGADPGKTEAIATDKQADYRRAEGACLTGRGYSVR